jgi:hypothetical protein
MVVRNIDVIGLEIEFAYAHTQKESLIGQVPTQFSCQLY